MFNVLVAVEKLDEVSNEIKVVDCGVVTSVVSEVTVDLLDDVCGNVVLDNENSATVTVFSGSGEISLAMIVF